MLRAKGNIVTAPSRPAELVAMALPDTPPGPDRRLTVRTALDSSAAHLGRSERLRQLPQDVRELKGQLMAREGSRSPSSGAREVQRRDKIGGLDGI